MPDVDVVRRVDESRPGRVFEKGFQVGAAVDRVLVMPGAEEVGFRAKFARPEVPARGVAFWRMAQTMHGPDRRCAPDQAADAPSLTSRGFTLRFSPIRPLLPHAVRAIADMRVLNVSSAMEHCLILGFGRRRVPAQLSREGEPGRCQFVSHAFRRPQVAEQREVVAPPPVRLGEVLDPSPDWKATKSIRRDGELGGPPEGVLKVWSPL